ERARAELTAEIKATALAHLAEHGAAGLSLRAVARDLGMASSAVYRYFPSRDELLTALIIDSYDRLGEAAERADATASSADFLERWLTLGRTVRGWALAHPHEYALLYGSPVPGYRAPQDTVPPATRVTAVLSAIVSDAVAAGALADGPPGSPPVPPRLAADAARLRELIMPGLDDAAVLRCLLAWLALFGAVSFELFGHLHTVVTDHAETFDHQLRALAGYVGLG
ncbi:MAG TPA: TetR/AcrR family transcriptional regulator, partial [Pseudonocardiaceae bacterium]